MKLGFSSGDDYPVSNIDDPVWISNEPVRIGGPVRLSNEPVRVIKNLFTVKSQIFVRYLFRTFVLLKKVRNLIPDENLFLSWGHRISMSFCFEALKSTKLVRTN